jgi:hypothetical protein
MLRRSLGVALAVAVAGTGCAARQPRRAVVGTPTLGTSTSASERESLEQYLSRARALTELAATAPHRAPQASLESTDQALRRALAELALDPTGERHRAVAAAYLRAGIPDQAFDHFTAALRLDRSDAGAYDGLARIWRDWGFPHLGLSDAYRAAYYAPRSAGAHDRAAGRRRVAHRDQGDRIRCRWIGSATWQVSACSPTRCRCFRIRRRRCR